MRLYVLIKDDPTYQRILENMILDLKDKLVGIAILPATSSHRNLFAFVKTFLIMLGPVLFMLKVYQAIRLTLLKTVWKLFNKGACYSIEAVAKKHSVEHMFIKDVNERSFIEKLKTMGLDIIISLQSQLIRSDLLSVPRIGIVNAHAGMLPAYRGPAPFFWALLNNEKHFGITTHFMDKKIDNGPIILQEKIEISPSETYYSLTNKVEKSIPQIILATIKKIEKNDFATISNDNEKATYCPYPSIWDAVRFRLKGKKTI